MNEAEARLILQAYRPGAADESDPQVAAALEAAAANPELARWLEEEQAFDLAVAAHLEAIPAPFGLKTRILAQAGEGKAVRKWRWAFGIATTVAVLLLATQLLSHRRSPTTASNPAVDYAREMVSFIRISPVLEMESDNLSEIKSWLAQEKKMNLKVPARLAGLEPIGCRVLSFRGREVTLVCFHREGKGLAHLFVVDRAALPELQPGSKPIFDNEHGWMTATWTEDGNVYMITMQGSRAALEEFLPHA